MVADDVPHYPQTARANGKVLLQMSPTATSMMMKAVINAARVHSTELLERLPIFTGWLEGIETETSVVVIEDEEGEKEENSMGKKSETA